jgi:hypothetical protein
MGDLAGMDGWLISEIVCKVGRRVAKLVALLLATTALWVRLPSPDISQKPQMGDFSKKVANTL